MSSSGLSTEAEQVQLCSRRRRGGRSCRESLKSKRHPQSGRLHRCASCSCNLLLRSFISACFSRYALHLQHVVSRALSPLGCEVACRALRSFSSPLGLLQLPCSGARSSRLSLPKPGYRVENHYRASRRFAFCHQFRSHDLGDRVIHSARVAHVSDVSAIEFGGPRLDNPPKCAYERLSRLQSPI